MLSTILLVEKCAQQNIAQSCFRACTFLYIIKEVSLNTRIIEHNKTPFYLVFLCTYMIIYWYFWSIKKPYLSSHISNTTSIYISICLLFIKFIKLLFIKLWQLYCLPSSFSYFLNGIDSSVKMLNNIVFHTVKVSKSFSAVFVQWQDAYVA